MATLESVEDWLIAIAAHTRQTKEALEGRNGGTGAGGEAKKQESLVERMGKRIESAIGAGLANRLGQIESLKNRGFQGTLEQSRFDYTMEQLSRQFAAVMKPVMDGMTYAAAQIESRMRKMSGNEQNRLMGGIIGAGLGFRFGGIPGAILGGTAGLSATGGGSSTTAIGGMLAGAYLGFRMGGPIGAVVGGTAGLVASVPRSYENETGTEYYNRQRREGASVFGAYISGMGEAARRQFDDPLKGKSPYGTWGRMGVIATTGEDPVTGARRRDVTPAYTQMGDAGQLHFLLQENLIRKTAADEGIETDGGPLKPIIDLLLKIFFNSLQ